MNELAHAYRHKILDLLSKEGKVPFGRIYEALKFKNPNSLTIHLETLRQEGEIILDGRCWRINPKLNNRTNMVFESIKQLSETEFSNLMVFVIKWRGDLKGLDITGSKTKIDPDVKALREEVLEALARLEQMDIEG